MKIITFSGGQTGVDRAALDAALALGLPCGGWCPKGRRAEDGVIPSMYPLKETPLAHYSQRTSWNIRDSDQTLIIYRGQMGPGSRLTQKLASGAGKLLMILKLKQLGQPWDTLTQVFVREMIEKQGVKTLNVAGPRESTSPGIHDIVMEFMSGLLVL